MPLAFGLLVLMGGLLVSTASVFAFSKHLRTRYYYRFLLFPAETLCSERLTRICNGPDIAHRSDGGLSTPDWCFEKSMINLRGGMLDDTVIFICNNLHDRKYSRFLECSSDTALIHRHICNVSDLCKCDIVFFPLSKHLHWSLITADLTPYSIPYCHSSSRRST